MKKKFRNSIVWILLGLLLITLFSYRIYKNYQEGKYKFPIDSIQEPSDIKEKPISIFLKEEAVYELEKDKKIPIISKSLQPLLIIKPNKEILELQIYLDDSEEDLLTSKFSDAIAEYDKQTNDLRLKFNYALEPQTHNILLKYKHDNREITERYEFVLILFDDFSSPLSQSKLWGLAESARLHNNWEFKDGKAIANPFTIESKSELVSSMFLIRRFRGDFFVQFDFIPTSNKISFLPYLYQRQLNFIFGSNSNRDIVLLEGNEIVDRGKFTFTSSEVYHVRLIRKGNTYKIYITTGGEFSDNNLVIDYEDKEPLKISFDVFGFAVWNNTDGIEIDNFYTANENIDSFFKNYAK